MVPPPGSLRPLSFVGPAGDRNDRGSRGAALVGCELGRRLAAATPELGSPMRMVHHHRMDALTAARPGLVALQDEFRRIVTGGGIPVAALPRCAASLATLPVVSELRPDSLIVWFDAHGDLNTPEDSTTGYLGGLVLSAALGWWDSGLGSGLTPARIVLGGARDLDVTERALIDAGTIQLASGPTLLDDLDRYVGAHPVYFHLDCDVLQPGTVPTEYVVPDELTLDGLAEVARRLSRTRSSASRSRSSKCRWTATTKRTTSGRCSTRSRRCSVRRSADVVAPAGIELVVLASAVSRGSTAADTPN